jgi:hypothetical protein
MSERTAHASAAEAVAAAPTLFSSLQTAAPDPASPLPTPGAGAGGAGDRKLCLGPGAKREQRAPRSPDLAVVAWHVSQRHGRWIVMRSLAFRGAQTLTC